MDMLMCKDGIHRETTGVPVASRFRGREEAPYTALPPQKHMPTLPQEFAANCNRETQSAYTWGEACEFRQSCALTTLHAARNWT